MASHLVIADDATGALEAGVLLAEAGFSAEVGLDPRIRPGAGIQAFALVAPTRHLAAEQARTLLLETLALHDAPALFLKTDSTLRGPIGACLQAALDARPGHGLVYIPSYPALGRAVRKGTLFVHGRPVAETEFAVDVLNPVRTSSIGELLASTCSHAFEPAESAAQLTRILAGHARLAVFCDAETEQDVASLIEICRHSPRPLILAGPAGCIRYWARTSPPPPPPPLPRVERWLLVCGSRHPASRAQAESAASLGIDVLLTPSQARQDPAEEVRVLASVAAARGARSFIVFGGDTALALWREVGVDTLKPLREILPGVAASASGPFTFVTKAGGFGPTDLVARILENWNR